MILLAESRRRRGLTLRVLRVHRGLSQKHLGELSGVNKATISFYETGRHFLGGVNRLRLLATLKVSERLWQVTLEHVVLLDALSDRGGGSAAGVGSPTPDPLLSYVIRLLGKGAGTLERELERGMAKDELLRKRGREIAGRVLQFLRSYRSLSQRALSEATGIAKSTISDFERGERGISADAKTRLLVALRLPERAWHETAEHMRWMDWLTEREERRADRYPDRHQVRARSEVEILAGKAARYREMELTEMLEMILSGVGKDWLSRKEFG